MRQLTFFIFCVLILTGLYSCHNENRRTITEAVPQDTGIYNPKWTYKTSDGYTIIDSLGFGPQNRRVLYYDNKKRLIGMAGMASEVVDFNFVRMIYGENDKIEAYLYANSLEEILGKEYFNDSIEYWYSAILDPDVDNAKYELFYLKRDAQGNIVEVSDPRSKRTISCSQKFSICPEVAENSSFWHSDIQGGLVLLNFYVEPIKKSENQYTIKKYCFYDLQTESTYNKGELTKVTVYSPETHKPVARIEKKHNFKDGTTIYDKSYPNNNNLYRSTWRKGVLISKEEVSQYGTILKQELYVPSKDGQAFIYYFKKLDYKTKKLVRTEEDRIDKQEFLQYNQEKDMMVMYEEMYEHWNTMFSVNLS